MIVEGQRCHCPKNEIHASDQGHMRIGVAVAGEVEKRRLHRQLVRGFLRGNNVNNTNLSPLYVNANNAPSNANTNIGFGN